MLCLAFFLGVFFGVIALRFSMQYDKFCLASPIRPDDTPIAEIFDDAQKSKRFCHSCASVLFIRACAVVMAVALMIQERFKRKFVIPDGRDAI